MLYVVMQTTCFNLLLNNLPHFFAVWGSLLCSRTELADNHPQWTLYEWACERRDIFCKNCVITLASDRSIQTMRKSHRATVERWKWLALLLLWRFRADLFAPVYNVPSASIWFTRPPQFQNAFILVSWSSCSKFTSEKRNYICCGFLYMLMTVRKLLFQVSCSQVLL